MKAEYWGSNKFAPQGIFHLECGEGERSECEHGVASEE